jgi:hypothetical protein
MMDTTADTSMNTTCDDSMVLAHSQESAAAVYNNGNGNGTAAAAKAANGNNAEPGDDHQGTAATFSDVSFSDCKTTLGTSE